MTDWDDLDCSAVSKCRDIPPDRATLRYENGTMKEDIEHFPFLFSPKFGKFL